jgi:hypothetical protein
MQIHEQCLVDDRFSAHNGLKPDIAPCPKSAKRRQRITAKNPGAWPGSIFQTLLVNQIVGAPATPAFCIALFNSALFAKVCAASTEANS